MRQLLTHTSGIKGYTDVPGFEKITLVPASKEEVIKAVAPYPLNFPSGDRWDYSNTGYFLLGMIIEKASGKTYADFLKEGIFTPLQMNATQINDLHNIVPNRCPPSVAAARPGAWSAGFWTARLARAERQRGSPAYRFRVPNPGQEPVWQCGLSRSQGVSRYRKPQGANISAGSDKA